MATPPRWRTLRELRRTRGGPIVVNAISIGILTVTGVLWLVQHLTKWPGGYLPWMVTLAAVLFAVGSYWNFHVMRKDRDAARQEVIDTFDSLGYRLALGGFVGVVFRHPTGETGYSFSLSFRNGGTEPIAYEVESMSVVMGNGHTAPSDSESLSTGAIILPGQSDQYGYPDIYAPIDPPLSGHIEGCVLYRHPKDPRFFRMRFKSQIKPITPQSLGVLPGVAFTFVADGDVLHDRVDPNA